LNLLTHSRIGKVLLVRLRAHGQDQTMTLKLLIVEDSEHIRTSLVSLIECIPGIDCVHTADTLVDALERVRKVLPTLVVLDLQLPDGLGVELIEPIKLLAPQARIAILTNHANDFNRRHCLASGADWFFDKSTEFETLLEVLRAQAALR
jgi:DNA-binding NarL/FixJ family response regulator